MYALFYNHILLGLQIHIFCHLMLKKCIRKNTVKVLKFYLNIFYNNILEKLVYDCMYDQGQPMQNSDSD